MGVITVGDCELLLLRRFPGRSNPLQVAFHTEMQRIDGHVQTPLQLARVDARIDPDFDEEITFEVIERGSAVHCVSAYEGDIVVLGSDGIFDNLFLDEVVDICNAVLVGKPGKFQPTHPQVLGTLAQRLVNESHAKSNPRPGGGMRDSPIGKGGKMDDTSVVVAEVVEWTEAHSEAWMQVTKSRRPIRPGFGNMSFMNCGNSCTADEDSDEYDDNMLPPSYNSRGNLASNRSREQTEEDDGTDDRRCVIV